MKQLDAEFRTKFFAAMKQKAIAATQDLSKNTSDTPAAAQTIMEHRGGNSATHQTTVRDPVLKITVPANTNQNVHYSQQDVRLGVTHNEAEAKSESKTVATQLATATNTGLGFGSFGIPAPSTPGHLHSPNNHPR